MDMIIKIYETIDIILIYILSMFIIVGALTAAVHFFFKIDFWDRYPNLTSVFFISIYSHSITILLLSILFRRSVI